MQSRSQCLFPSSATRQNTVFTYTDRHNPAANLLNWGYGVPIYPHKPKTTSTLTPVAYGVCWMISVRLPRGSKHGVLHAAVWPALSSYARDGCSLIPACSPAHQLTDCYGIYYYQDSYQHWTQGGTNMTIQTYSIPTKVLLLDILIHFIQINGFLICDWLNVCAHLNDAVRTVT